MIDDTEIIVNNGNCLENIEKPLVCASHYCILLTGGWDLITIPV